MEMWELVMLIVTSIILAIMFYRLGHLRGQMKILEEMQHELEKFEEVQKAIDFFDRVKGREQDDQ